jgi:hypothetical protein
VDGRGHMTELLRVQQGPFALEHCLEEADWTFENLIRNIPVCSSLAGIDSSSLKSAITGGL